MRTLLTSAAALAMGLAASTGHAQTVSVPAGTNLATLPPPTSTTTWDLEGGASLSQSPSPLLEFTPPSGTPGLTINGAAGGSTITLNDGAGHFGRFSNSSLNPADNSIVLNLSNVTFTGGDSGGAFNSGGGVIAALTGGSVTINGTLDATGNSAPNNPANPAGADGGVILGNGVTVTGGVVLTGNSAGEDAGAIAAGPGDISLAGTGGDVTITSNTAGRDAGALAGVNVTIGNANAVVDIEHNTATTGSGGAIAATNVVITGKSITLSSNSASPTAGFGGAIIANGAVTLNGDTTADNNSAGGNGGVIYSAAGNVVVNGAASLSNNTAGGTGGAVRAADGDIVLSATAGNVLLAGNTAGVDGGALAAFTGNVSIGNQAGSVDVEGNTATTGAGGAIDAAGDVTVNGSAKFLNNSAGGAGGAIWAGGNLTLNATSGNFTFAGNTEGGAGTQQANAIFLDNTGGAATATFNVGAGRTITFLDPIASNLANGAVTVLVTGGGTVDFDGSQHSRSVADETSLILANTTIAAGGLRVDNGAVFGAPGSTMLVKSGASLGGNGTVGGAVTNAGLVTPGSASGGVGTLTINGAFTQTPTGTLAIQLTPAGGSRLDVTGAAHLGGTLLFDPVTGVFRKGQVFDFLDAASIDGAFATTTINGPSIFAVSHVADSLLATVTVGNFALTHATANQRSILTAFNQYPVGVSDFDPLANAIIAMPAGPAQNLAINELGSEISPDLVTATRNNVRSQLGGYVHQLAARPAGDGAGPSDPFWIEGGGHFGGVGSDGNAHGFSDSGADVTGGVQHDFGASTLGGAVGWQESWLTLDGLPQEGDTSTISAGLYGEHRWGALYADLGGLIGFDHGSVKRLIAAPGVPGRQAIGGFDGFSAGISAVVGERFPMAGGWLLTPQAGITWSHVDQDGYTERGAGGADLQIQSEHQDAVQSLLGIGASTAFGPGFSGDASIDWAHDFNDLTPRAVEAFAPVAVHFTIAGVNPGHDAALLHAGLNYHMSRMTFYLRYDGSYSGRADDSQIAGGLRVAF